MPTCDELTKAVGEYNSENNDVDVALRSALDAIQSVPPSFGRFLAEVCLIADWGTIQQFPFHDRVAMAKEIETAWPVLQPMRNWHAENWDAETKILTDAVELLSPTQLLPTPGGRKQLSFLSKYLHNCVNDAFPIWDGNARKALHSSDDDRTWQSYSNWVIYVRQEAARHKTCCLEQIRLPGESVLRTFDKALYIMGREPAPGRATASRGIKYQLVVGGKNILQPRGWTAVEYDGQALALATGLGASAFEVATGKVWPVANPRSSRVEALRAAGEKLAAELSIEQTAVPPQTV
jgi:hypothetical protein